MNRISQRGISKSSMKLGFILISIVLANSCTYKNEERLLIYDWECIVRAGHSGKDLIFNYRFYDDGTYSTLFKDYSTGSLIESDHTHEQAKQKRDVDRYYISSKIVKLEREGTYESDYKTSFKLVSTEPLPVVFKDSIWKYGSWHEVPFLYFNESGQAFEIIRGYISGSCDMCETWAKDYLKQKNCSVLCITETAPCVPKYK